ncbi:hypothetical protein I2W78_18700 [Streptomyces spinoverrucosus]|uniref:hypothetical protein n=1 Tax=Streptomyces spinoverrucosus TaxID=284043 RepID=UPI0018C3C285|nr:hypothetical protein [Streptomyces spinoverrucosus]MBG0853822.1 hypothetical protein [Streptomyces spinoverrucosus]
MTSYQARIGDIVQDTATSRIGKVMGFQGPYVQLRPIGGGQEWDADPEALEPVPVGAALSESVAAANARSRGEQPWR